MAIQKFEDDLNIISKLGDNPGTDNGLTTPQFRDMFDKAGLMIQKFINDVMIPAMDASNNPQEGLSMQGGINMNGQMLNGIKAPAASDEAANKGYVDGGIAAAKKYADDKHFELTATIPVSYWAQHASGAYYAIVDNLNVRDTDKVDIDVLIVNHENLDAMVELEEAWCNVIKVAIADGYIVLHSKDKPEVDLPIKLKVVR